MSQILHPLVIREMADHSFQSILDRADPASEAYVLSQDRHEGLLAFLADRVSIEDANILDCGCGGGIVTRGLAQMCREVTGLDGNEDNVRLAAEKAQAAGLDNAHFTHGQATELPFGDRHFDLVLLNGVLEWVGVNEHGEAPEARQEAVLREAFRVLRPGGVLYLGIENRFHPGTLLRDPHTALPLVNALPRRAADLVSQRRNGHKFQVYVHGLGAMIRLLNRAGFTDLQPYTPFPSYQFPVAYIRLGSRQQSLADIAALDVDKVRRVMRDSGRDDDIENALSNLRRRARLGVLGLLSHDHAFVAIKR